MKVDTVILFIVALFYAYHNKKGHPNACFTVTNLTMLIGDTVRIQLCGPISRDSEWNMGDTIYKGAGAPKHVYRTIGTFTIKLKSYEHIGGAKMFTHWQKRAVSEAQQAVTVQ